VNYDRNKNNELITGVDNLDIPFVDYPLGGLFLLNYENEIYNGTLAATGGPPALATEHVASNVLSYEPDGVTDSIESNMTPLGMTKNLTYFTDAPTVDGIFILPAMECEGNWFGKAEISEWGLRVMFYRGRQFPVRSSGGGTFLAPWATHHCNRYLYGVPPGGDGIQGYFEIFGNWSLAFENQTYGMIEVWWKNWLKVLEVNSGLKGKLNMNIMDYLNLRWSDVLQLQNTNFILKQLNDQLPFNEPGSETGSIEFEAVRMPL
jgi:hypothetical protein